MRKKDQPDLEFVPSYIIARLLDEAAAVGEMAWKMSKAKAVHLRQRLYIERDRARKDMARKPADQRDDVRYFSWETLRITIEDMPSGEALLVIARDGLYLYDIVQFDKKTGAEGLTLKELLETSINLTDEILKDPREALLVSDGDPLKDEVLKRINSGEAKERKE